MNLEDIVKQLNETELTISEIEQLNELRDNNGMNALQLACSRGYDNAAKKLLEYYPIKHEERVFKSGSMVRQAAIGGSGISTIHSEPRASLRETTEWFKFDVLEKDYTGKSPYEYALSSENKELLAEMYRTRDLNEVSKVNCNGETISVLKYFLQEFSNSSNDLNAVSLRTIIDEIVSRQSELAHELTSDECYSYIKKYKESSFKNITQADNQRFFNNFIKSIGKENLDICLDDMIVDDTKGMIDGMYHIELLKMGANVDMNSIQLLNEKYKTIPEGQKDSYEQIYMIDKNDFKTIAGKSPQVIEAYFGKNYLEVLKNYITEDKIDLQTILPAIECPYDLPFSDTRIGELFNQGLKLEQIESNGSIFSFMNTRQMFQILSKPNVNLTDEDVIAICRSASLRKAEIAGEKELSQVENFAERIADYQVKGDVQAFITEIDKTPIKYMLAGMANDYGIDNPYDDIWLEDNLHSQLKQYLENQKQLLEQQKALLTENQDTISQEEVPQQSGLGR